MPSKKISIFAIALIALGVIAAASYNLTDPWFGAKAQAEEEKSVDIYTVPEADSKTLMTFIETVLEYQPKSREDFTQYIEKGPDAMMAAARKIMEQETDKKSELYQKAKEIHFQVRMQMVVFQTPEEQLKTIANVVEVLSKAAASDPREAISYMQLISMMGDELTKSGNEALAGKAFEDLAAGFKKVGNPDLDEVVDWLESSARLKTIVGKEIQVTGKTYEGKEFDWSAYRGKVVLIDFWATWCGPCRAEFPNIRANYEKYHDRGFEVVGINTDQNREALDQFLGMNQFPWTTVCTDVEDPKATARFYAVNSIPEVILVGKDGKVISRHVRGERLGMMLEELLGSDEAETKTDAAADVKGDTKI